MLDSKPVDIDALEKQVEHAERHLNMQTHPSSTVGKAKAELKKLENSQEDIKDAFRDYKKVHSLHFAQALLAALQEQRKVGIKAEFLDQIEEEVYDDLYSELKPKTAPKNVSIDTAEWYGKLYQAVLHLRFDALNLAVKNHVSLEVKQAYESCGIQKKLEAFDFTNPATVRAAQEALKSAKTRGFDAAALANCGLTYIERKHKDEIMPLYGAGDLTVHAPARGARGVAQSNFMPFYLPGNFMGNFMPFSLPGSPPYDCTPPPSPPRSSPESGLDTTKLSARLMEIAGPDATMQPGLSSFAPRPPAILTPPSLPSQHGSPHAPSTPPPPSPPPSPYYQHDMYRGGGGVGMSHHGGRHRSLRTQHHIGPNHHHGGGLNHLHGGGVNHYHHRGGVNHLGHGDVYYLGGGGGYAAHTPMHSRFTNRQPTRAPRKRDGDPVFLRLGLDDVFTLLATAVQLQKTERNKMRLKQALATAHGSLSEQSLERMAQINFMNVLQKQEDIDDNKFELLLQFTNVCPCRLAVMCFRPSCRLLIHADRLSRPGDRPSHSRT